MKSDYEERQAARKKRYEDIADKNKAESEARLNQAHKMGEAIPFGQPILVGHHSEKRDRNYRERIHRNYEKGFEAMEKAKHYESKAESVGTGGISSDDPNAIEKLREKLVGLEAYQEQMKTINTAHKAFLKKPESLEKSTLPESLKEMIRTYKPEYSWIPHPIAPYQLTNNGAAIRQIKARIAQLEQKEQRADAMRAESKTGEAVKSEEFEGGFRIEQNAEENRVFMFFPSKPSEAIWKLCKREGFRWAKTIGAWSRHLSGGAVYSAKRIKDAWLAERGEAQGEQDERLV